MRPFWVQLRALRHAQVLLILPCNAAACVGNYFRAEVYRQSGWNTWREADWLLRDLRRAGRVAFAAVDSSTIETAPDDPRGAIVLETEMERARNPQGEDWGAPSWRCFRPTRAGRWNSLEALTESTVRGVQRVQSLGIPHVLALVNPRAYFLALAAAVEACGVRSSWVVFQPPAHPRHLLPAVREVAAFVQAAAAGAELPGGIYPIPDLYAALRAEAMGYRDLLPMPWRAPARVPGIRAVGIRWAKLIRAAGRSAGEEFANDHGVCRRVDSVHLRRERVR